MAVEGGLIVAIDRETLGRLRRRVREVLKRDWDPIAGSPADEYDDDVGKVAVMLYEGAADEDLRKYLLWAETKRFGSRADGARSDHVIAALRRIEIS
jgi:hypothetical protein